MSNVAVTRASHKEGDEVDNRIHRVFQGIFSVLIIVQLEERKVMGFQHLFQLLPGGFQKFRRIHFLTFKGQWGCLEIRPPPHRHGRQD